MTRFNLLPDERFLSLSARLGEQMHEAARALTAERLPDVLDPLMRQVIGDAFTTVGAHEGSVWLADQDQRHLVPGYNTGPNAARFVGGFQQPLDRGIVSLVFKSGVSFSENDVYKNQRHDKTLDRSLGLVTCAMIVVPLYFAGDLRGVISCVQVKPAAGTEADPPGFGPNHLRRIEELSGLLTRLVDHALLGTIVGWARHGARSR